MKPKRHSERKSTHGSTLTGLLIGLVLGVVAAALVVWYLNKTPTPFNEQTKAAQHPPLDTKTPSPSSSEPAPLPGKPGDPIPEKRFQFYDILPGKSEAKPEISPAESLPQKDNKEQFFLQVGAFHNADEADSRKAQLALQGQEATIQQIMLQDKTLYRVRLGPYYKIEDLNRVRAELSKQGIESSLIKKD